MKVYVARDGDGRLFMYKGHSPPYDKIDKKFIQFPRATIIRSIAKEDERILGFHNIRPGGIREVVVPLKLKLTKRLKFGGTSS